MKFAHRPRGQLRLRVHVAQPAAGEVAARVVGGGQAAALATRAQQAPEAALSREEGNEHATSAYLHRKVAHVARPRLAAAQAQEHGERREEAGGRVRFEARAAHTHLAAARHEAEAAGREAGGGADRVEQRRGGDERGSAEARDARAPAQVTIQQLRGCHCCKKRRVADERREVY